MRVSSVLFMCGLRVLVVGVQGCASPAASTVAEPATAATKTEHGHAHDPTSHNHDRGNMMIASNGVVDALLTSHLSSKSGNELDVFVEKRGTPEPLTTTALEARAWLPDGREKRLTFACAPLDERPADEAEGTCSHFVARAEWMNPTVPIQVAMALPLRSGDIPYTWRSFDPRRYAHHVE